MPIYKGDTPIVEASGRKGKDGKDGINGENGATYTPSISEEGILSWTNDKDLPNPEPINIKGQDGVSYILTKSEDGTKIILTGSDGSVQEISDSNTTYGVATQTESGLMSAEDKAKLNNMSSGDIENKANKDLSNVTKEAIRSKAELGNVNFSAEIIFEGVSPTVDYSPQYVDMLHPLVDYDFVAICLYWNLQWYRSATVDVKTILSLTDEQTEVTVYIPKVSSKTFPVLFNNQGQVQTSEQTRIYGIKLTT